MRKLACVALIVLSAIPVLRDDYLFSDDYYWYEIESARPQAAEDEATMMDLMNGRPLHLIAFRWMTPLMTQRAHLIPLRLLGVLLIIATAWAMAAILRRRFADDVADWVATALVALPGFILYSFWLIGMPCLFGAFLGVLAAERAIAGKRVWAVLLLIAGLCFYQPHALLYFSMLAFWVASASRLRREDTIMLALGVLAIAIYYICARAVVAAYHFDMPQRGELAFAPLDKLAWLLLQAVPFAAKLWSIMLPPAFGLLVLGALLVRRRPRDVRRILFVVAACVLTVLPHLAVKETVVRWRILLPLSLAFALLAFVGARVQGWPRLVLPALVVALTGARTFEVARYAVAPERAIVLAIARGMAGETEVSILRPGDTDSICVPRVSNDEFTAPSSQRDFAVAGIVRLASELYGLPRPNIGPSGFPLDLRQIATSVCQETGAQFP